MTYNHMLSSSHAKLEIQAFCGAQEIALTKVTRSATIRQFDVLEPLGCAEE